MKNRNEIIIEKQENRDQKSWHCDTYCRKVRYVTCEGKEQVDENSPELCPYFDEMLY